ncbi:pseudouridine synthase [Lactarius quietus]|nr:pseudouridine synthase [Lactarius quietus]
MACHPTPEKFALVPQARELPDYETWTREELIARLKLLTGSPTLQTTTPTPASPSLPPVLPLLSPSPPSTPLSPHRSLSKKGLPEGTKSKREFDFSAYPTRKIALKFSYAGAGYGGLAWQACPTPLPTVEGVLFAALAKARLVDPDGGLEGCGWERSKACNTGEDTSKGVIGDNDASALKVPERDIRYLHTLNAILPPSIRVYAWAPVASSFSARFSCRTRHYKYFFSARSLDVDAMRAAAARLVGEHDFRNLCKLDPAKQLTSFRRRILRADISPTIVGGGGGSDMDMHVLDLVGSAFLYNQVRHIMAVLLLIGTRLEAPNVVSALLNADPVGDDEGDAGQAPPLAVLPEGEEPPPPRVTCKPEYQMADALPLVLWDCTYAAEDVQWRADDAVSDGGSVGLYSQLVGLAERAQVEATLADHFLAAAVPLHGPAARGAGSMLTRAAGPWDVPLGGGMTRREGNYVPLLNRKRLESVEVVNERWLKRREGKGRTSGNARICRTHPCMKRESLGITEETAWTKGGYSRALITRTVSEPRLSVASNGPNFICSDLYLHQRQALMQPASMALSVAIDRFRSVEFSTP